MYSKRSIINGVISFIIVLLFMPIGHFLMVLIEIMLHEHKLIGAGIIGFLGFFSLTYGIIKNKNNLTATMAGFLSGILIWTGWVEFSFVWIADKHQVAPLIENGEIATRPEYLVMLSSVGLLSTIVIFYIFSQSYCNFFLWIQEKIGIHKQLNSNKKSFKFIAMTTFIETIVILWFFYILLLLIYDNSIAGDKHILTYLVAFGSLAWSIYLTSKLLTIKKMEKSIRYAIPTVIIFWNFVEITGRWDLFKEIWVYPKEHLIENLLIMFITLFFIYLFFKKGKIKKNTLKE